MCTKLPKIAHLDPAGLSLAVDVSLREQPEEDDEDEDEEEDEQEEDDGNSDGYSE
jgi:hypothetical protein